MRRKVSAAVSNYLLVPSLRRGVLALREMRKTIHEAIFGSWPPVGRERHGVFSNAKGVVLRSILELRRVGESRKGAAFELA
jgi:hypothetical protein